jgi:hypothetical protein
MGRREPVDRNFVFRFSRTKRARRRVAGAFHLDAVLKDVRHHLDVPWHGLD